MRVIDKKNWSRRNHFEVFNAFAQPHFSMCTNVDLSDFYPFIKQQGISFTVAIVYILARTANAIPEFRHRIRGVEVIEHEIVHPSTTILTKDDLFSFCTIEYSKDFGIFAKKATKQIMAVKERLTLDNGPETDNLMFMTSIPWVTFTSFMHPLPTQPADSVPRFAWGKYFEEDKSLKMPLSVQGHHALMDGLHVAKFYSQVQDYLYRPEIYLNRF